MSTEKKQKRKKPAKAAPTKKEEASLIKRSSVKLVIVLFAVTAISGLILSFVNEVTYSRIALSEKQATDKALVQALPSADTFTDMKFVATEGVEELYEAHAKGEVIGYCAKVAPVGFGGRLTLVVGMDTKRVITGIAFISGAETPGLGTRATEKSFLNRFIGKTGEIEAVKTSSTAENRVEAVSGATVSSRAVAKGTAIAVNAVNTALAAAEKEGK